MRKDDLEKVKEVAKNRAKEIFRSAPPAVEEKFRKEKTLGTPRNLIRPDNKNE